jgi:hypothetical protein
MVALIIFGMLFLAALILINKWVSKRMKSSLGVTQLPTFAGDIGWWASMGMLVAGISCLQLVIKGVILLL